jgi:hypothetical protein
MAHEARFGVMTLLRLLVAASAGLSLWFVFYLGAPWRSESPAVAWLLAAWAWTTAAFQALLLLALFRIDVPLWLVVLVLAAQDGVFVWRLVLLYRARRADLTVRPGSRRERLR